MNGPETTSNGVDELIARLRSDGVEAGRAEADQLVSQAKAEAERLLTAARREADGYLAKAKQDSDNYVKAGELALQTAMRDAVLQMRAGVTNRFRRDVERMVSEHTSDPDVLKTIILEVAGRAGERLKDGPVEVILPAEVIGPEQIREKAAEIQSGKLTEYVLGLTRDMLRDGVTLRAEGDLSGGIRVRVEDDDVEIDLSDEAIAAVLMEHLQPRFRAVMEGVIRG